MSAEKQLTHKVIPEKCSESLVGASVCLLSSKVDKGKKTRQRTRWETTKWVAAVVDKKLNSWNMVHTQMQAKSVNIRVQIDFTLYGQ